MTAVIILLVCASVCLLGRPTKAVTDSEYYCIYNNTPYQPNTWFQVDTCAKGYFDDDCYANITFTCCYYNNKTYEANKEFEVKPCLTGYCSDDGSIDFRVTCCYYENKTYALNSTINTQCWNGFCYQNGDVRLQHVPCTSPRCRDPVLVEGQCCKTCGAGSTPICYYNGAPYDVGPVPSDDPCKSCNCTANNGLVSCRSGPCPILRCPSGQEPTLKAGDCCRKCTPKNKK